MRKLISIVTAVPWRRAKPLLIFAIFVAAWSAVLTYAVKSELLWDALSPRFAADQRHNTQNLLMSAPGTAERVLVIGDSAFNAQLQKIAGSDSQLEFLTIDAIDPGDIATALIAYANYTKRNPGKFPVCRVVLQASPYFVTRMRDRGRRQDGSYLRALQRQDFAFAPNRLTEAFFQTLEKWARSRPASTNAPNPDRPLRFPPQISMPDQNLENWVRVEKQIRRIDMPFLIVADRRLSDYADAPALLNHFDREFRERISRGKETNGRTSWAEFRELPGAGWSTCSDA